MKHLFFHVIIVFYLLRKSFGHGIDLFLDYNLDSLFETGEDGHNNLRFMQEYNEKALLKNKEDFKYLRIKSIYVGPEKWNLSGINFFHVEDELIKRFEEKYATTINTLFGNLLSIYPIEKPIIITKSNCPFTDDNTTNTIIVADLIIIYAFENEDNSFTARSGICLRSKEYYNRPIIGLILINLKYNNLLENREIIDRKLFNTLTHEYVHILAFTNSSYPHYISPEGELTNPILNKNNSIFISSPLVKYYARKYYNCSSLVGMPLEKSGTNFTSGSHWSRDLLLEEIMTGSTIFKLRIFTNFTLKLLEDSGWYQPDYSYAHPTLWGRNKGCDFTIPKCEKYSEFCTSANKLGCTYDNQYIALCKNDGLSDCSYFDGIQDCRDNKKILPEIKELINNITIKIPFTNFNEKSKCVVAKYADSNYLPSCLEARCVVSTKQVKITIYDKYSPYTFLCSENEGNKTKIFTLSNNNDFTIICPFYSRVCFDQDDSIEYANDTLSVSYVGVETILYLFIILFML